MRPRHTVHPEHNPSSISNDVHLPEVSKASIRIKRGLISSELSDAHLTETIGPRIRTKPRVCSSSLQDLARQECSGQVYLATG